ncbi:MAG: hypothetical protein ACK4NC_04590 [Candidatus Gracilibacteria bacterium]
MAALLLTTGSSGKQGIKKKTLAERVSIGANSLVIVIISLICMVSVSYLLHSNKSSAKGYVLEQLQKEQRNLDQDLSFWELKIARAKSLEALEKSSIAQSMTKAKKLEFIRGDTAVAVNK